MPDYTAYMTAAGIGNREVIQELKQYFPRYGKPVQSMVCHPEKYAVQLTAEAEAVLAARFGDHPGLSENWMIVDGADLIPLKQKRRERRLKNNKLTVRLDDSLFTQLRELYGKTAFASMQDLVEAAIVEFINRRAEA